MAIVVLVQIALLIDEATPRSASSQAHNSSIPGPDQEELVLPKSAVSDFLRVHPGPARAPPGGSGGDDPGQASMSKPLSRGVAV